MSNQSPMASKKNQWLYSQVDCEFPTKESIDGLQLYQQSVANRSVVELDVTILKQTAIEMSHYLVDFHRLTIMFAQLQSRRWPQASQQALMIEFLTQIILSAEHDLYVSFVEGEPIGAAIVTRENERLLFSDVVYQQKFGRLEVEEYLSQLALHLASQQIQTNQLFLEV